LLHTEQDFGDMIQFARYIPLVKERGGTIIVEAQPQLSRLFSTIEGVGQVVNAGADTPPFDVYAPMMSLARIFATTPDTVPANASYLNAPDAFAGQLPATLSSQLKVGISWAGSATHQNAARRSCPFKHFTDLGGKMNDFADTAAVIGHLDFVISVDTAVAHLAGAMGKPVWVALAHPGDWRWMQDGDSSPWYPTMRLFRQSDPGDWAGVFEALKRRWPRKPAASRADKPFPDSIFLFPRIRQNRRRWRRRGFHHINVQPTGVDAETRRYFQYRHIHRTLRHGAVSGSGG